jgi:PAS domain S-box-containing protein
MGDLRFEASYKRVLDAEDRNAAILQLGDQELIDALGGASRGGDPLLANVLATAVSNRHARLESVFRHMGEGCVLLAQDARVRLLNPAFERILGWKLDDLRDRPIHDALHPDCTEGPECPLVDVFLGGGERQVDEAQLVRKDGARVPVAFTVSPLVRGEEMQGAVLLVRDIAQHQLAMEAVARLAAIVETTTDAIYMLTPGDIITSWNRGAEALYGYTAEEATGRHVGLIVPPELSGELQLVAELVHRQGQSATFETKRRRKDGALLDVSLSISPLKAGRSALGASVTSRDITARKREQQIVKAALDAAPSAMVAIDESGRLILANAQAERLFGYEKGDLVGRVVEDLVPDRLRVGHGLLRTIYAAHPTTRPMGAGLDLRARRRDGTEFPVEISLTPVPGSSKEGLVVIAAIRETEPRP